MVKREHIEPAIKALQNNVLQYAEASLHPGQFKAYRKLVLDAFGRHGFGAELDRIFKDDQRKAADWNGPEYIGQGKGAGMSEPEKRKRRV